MPSSWEIWVSSSSPRSASASKRRHSVNLGKTPKLVTMHVGPAADITGIRLVIKGTDDQSILRLYEFTPEFGTNPSPEWDAKVARDASRLNPETCRKDAAATDIPIQCTTTEGTTWYARAGFTSPLPRMLDPYRCGRKF